MFAMCRQKICLHRAKVPWYQLVLVPRRWSNGLKSVMTAWKAQEVRGRAAEVLPAQECIEDLSTWFSSAVTAAFCKAVPSEES